MTKYEITATNMNDEEITTKISAPDEKTARRDFKTWCDYREISKAKITTIEAVEENIPATKLQEIEAVQQIRDILATLGEDSYTATALEGCLEDAENNIENDFADSMKARYESAKEDADHYFDLYKISQEAHEKTFDELQAANKRIYDMEHEHNELLKVQNAHKITEDDLYDIRCLLNEKITDIRDKLTETAEQIVALADDPTSSEFIQTVKDNRAYKSDLEYYTALINRISNIC